MKIKYLLPLLLIVFLVFAPTILKGKDGIANIASSATPTIDPIASGEIVPQFIFTNTSAIEICALYLSPVSVESWGPNQLLNNQTIAVGQQFILTNLHTGVYNTKVVGCNGTGEKAFRLEIKN